MHRFAFAFAFALAACGAEEPEPIEESSALGACRASCDGGGDGGGSGTWQEGGPSPLSTCCDCRRSFTEIGEQVCFGDMVDEAVDQCPDCNDL